MPTLASDALPPPAKPPGTPRETVRPKPRPDADWGGPRPDGDPGGLPREALARMAAAGRREAWLTVNLNNPGAATLYRRLGYRSAGRRARYQRRLRRRPERQPVRLAS
jgi:hypothetical protein